MTDSLYFRIIQTKTFMQMMGISQRPKYYRIKTKHDKPLARIKFPPNVRAGFEGEPPGYYYGHCVEFKRAIYENRATVYRDFDDSHLLELAGIKGAENDGSSHTSK